jgi:hypothetical protein
MTTFSHRGEDEVPIGIVLDASDGALVALEKNRSHGLEHGSRSKEGYVSL